MASLPAGDGAVRSAENSLSESARTLRDSTGAHARIRERMLRHIQPSDALLRARDAVQPAAGVSRRLWEVVSSRIGATMGQASLWEKIRTSLTPSTEVQAFLRGRVLGQLQPATAPASSFPRYIRWSAVAALVVVLLRVSPALFLAPQSSAESPVLLVPGQGDVMVLVGGLWQPVTQEITLSNDVRIRTGAHGAATVIVHDDGVVRLSSGATVFLQHLNRQNGHFTQTTPTFTFEAGRVWVQTLMPSTSVGWDLVVPYAHVSLQEGSVSLAMHGGSTDVVVWDRMAQVTDGAQEAMLVAGDGVRVRDAALSFLHYSLDDGDMWVQENIQRDAVHRKEIALLQQQRLARNAGILPTSTLYPVKRVAEAVDMLFTFGEEARTQKLLAQADTRLNEAAALLQTGTGSAAAAEHSLAEYRSLLLAIASGSGQEMAVRSLVQKQVASDVAGVAAALPDDQSYVLKKAVLETSAALPESGVRTEDVQGTLLVDTLSALTRRAQNGDLSGAMTALKTLSPSLALTSTTSPLSSQVRKEARASLAVFAQVVAEAGSQTESGAILSSELSQYLPIAPSKIAVRPLSDDEINTLVGQMVIRIFSYKMPRSRYDQLLAEFRSIENLPDRGRILRRLYHELPENGLAEYVRTEIQKVREEVQRDGSGGVVPLD